jgi:hypothetical protein
VAHTLQDLKRPDILGAKLLAGTGYQRLGRTVEQKEPDPVPDTELQSAVMSVVVLASVLLRLEQPGTDFCDELVAAREQGIYGVGLSSALLIRQQGRRSPTIDHLKWRCAEGGVERRVVAELRPW